MLDLEKELQEVLGEDSKISVVFAKQQADPLLRRLRQLYTKAKHNGEIELYLRALKIHNDLLIINGDI